MTETSSRFPAEWEPQAAILIAWPNAETDWAARLGEVEDTYVALVQAITDTLKDTYECPGDHVFEQEFQFRIE